jgi:hypothetical protein
LGKKKNVDVLNIARLTAGLNAQDVAEVTCSTTARTWLLPRTLIF